MSDSAGTGQEPYASMPKDELEGYFLFNLTADYNELVDLKAMQAEEFARLKALLDSFVASCESSQANETGCAS